MRQLVIMMKAPQPGRVKTRLGAEIGPGAACWWYRHQCARLVRRVGQDPRWQTWLAVAPDSAQKSGALPADPHRLAQGQGDLGERMRRMFAAMAPGPTLVIGADIPGVDRREIWQGFEALRGADAAFGPAPDGGYWMIGLKNRAQLDGQMLRHVRWSTAHALADTLASLPKGARVGYGPVLRDVDRLADLEALRAEKQR